MSLMHAIALAGLVLAGDQPAPLTATGKWSVNFVEKMCLVERSYGPADRATIFAMRPNTLARNIEVRISEVEPGYISRNDAGKVTLQPSGRTFPVKIGSFGPIANGRRMTSFWLEDVDIGDLVMAKEIVIDRRPAGMPLVIAPAGSAEVVTAADGCSDGLLRLWGIDPVAMHKLSRQPAPVGGLERTWFKPKDYPKTARKNFRVGRTVALIQVGIEGNVAACNIAESAGNPDLDSKTCAVLTERGRYEPGLDAAGRPVPSQKLVSVMWTLWRTFFR